MKDHRHHHAGFRVACAIAVMLGLLLSLLPASAQTPPAGGHPPVLAYYYIWYTPASWQRAKIDIPLLGPYSSDDAGVMLQHIRWAKEAGIEGFIVSWKHTSELSARLETLVQIARDEHFKLVINYEALDFYRRPLPLDRVSSDLAWFARTYRDEPVFDLFGKPTVILAGSWEFSTDQIGEIAAQTRPALTLLASAKQPDAFEKIGDLVDGNAYYWSSVDPATFQDYPGKLQRMGEVVHAHGGIWIAPAAPGFDARHLGGERAVPRRDGQTLETEFAAALASRPDAIGLISWNEFSESSQIEPSCLYGDQALRTIAALLGGSVAPITLHCDRAALATAQASAQAATPDPQATPIAGVAPATRFDWDSSAPQGTADRTSRIGTLVLIGLLTGLMGFSITRVTRRALKDTRTDHKTSTGVHLIRPGGKQS